MTPTIPQRKPRRHPGWEVRISVYRNGRRVWISDALGQFPDTALTDAHNDLELWAEGHPEAHGNYAETYGFDSPDDDVEYGS